MDEFLEFTVNLIKLTVTDSVVMLVTMMGVGTFFNISFGVFRTAILKCMVIVVSFALIKSLLPFFFAVVFMTSLTFSLAVWCVVLMALFDIEIAEAGIFTIIYHIVQFLIWFALHVPGP